VPIGLGHHPGEHDHGGEAQPSISKGFLDLREANDESGCDLPVVSRSPGEAKFPMEVVEERGVAEFPVRGHAVEFGEGEEEIGQGASLGAEELCMTE
jgi:hypothetical protein